METHTLGGTWTNSTAWKFPHLLAYLHTLIIMHYPLINKLL